MTQATDPNDALETRQGLPDALKTLLQDYPRDAWDGHANFGGLVAFWLERHLMFRRLLEAMQGDAQAAVDRALDPQLHHARLARFGNAILGGLHEHHQIEDHHYFPRLVTRERALERGFAILDKDHHAMDALLARFAGSAEGVLQGHIEPGAFLTELDGFAALLDLHLEDEEDLIVPVILKHGAAGF
jgi:hemerythrin-like domain-containing protein